MTKVERYLIVLLIAGTMIMFWWALIEIIMR